MISEVINDSELEIKLKLFENIIVTGGSTLMNGFVGGLESDMNKVAPIEVKPGVIAIPRRKESAWIGASIVSSISSLHPFCVSRHDYKEIGATILDKKCP